VKEIILSTNSGQIGVLPNHAPINIAIDMGPLRIRLLNDQWLTVVLWSGFARIVNNEIIILGNDAELGSDIDPEEAQQALEIGEANLSKAKGTKELVEVKLALRRARIRVEAVNWISPRQSKGFVQGA
jgi:F-type H+-transporting ATPase subunit epsilon